MGLRADIEDVRSLENGYQKVSPFTDGLIQHSSEPIEENRSLAAVDGVERRGENRRGHSETEGRLRQIREERNRCLTSHLAPQGKKKIKIEKK